MGLHVMMFHATVAGIGYSLGLIFAAIFPSSTISWQAAVFFGMYFFIMSVIMCLVHVYITYTMRLVNLFRLLPYAITFAMSLSALSVVSNSLHFGILHVGNSSLTLYSIVVYILIIINVVSTASAVVKCRHYALKFPDMPIFQKAWALSSRLTLMPLWQLLSKLAFFLVLQRLRYPWPENFDALYVVQDGADATVTVTVFIAFTFTFQFGVMCFVFLIIDPIIRLEYVEQLMRVSMFRYLTRAWKGAMSKLLLCRWHARSIFRRRFSSNKIYADFEYKHHVNNINSDNGLAFPSLDLLWARCDSNWNSTRMGGLQSMAVEPNESMRVQSIQSGVVQPNQTVSEKPKPSLRAQPYQSMAVQPNLIAVIHDNVSKANHTEIQPNLSVEGRQESQPRESMEATNAFLSLELWMGGDPAVVNRSTAAASARRTSESRMLASEGNAGGWAEDSRRGGVLARVSDMPELPEV